MHVLRGAARARAAPLSRLRGHDAARLDSSPRGRLDASAPRLYRGIGIVTDALIVLGITMFTMAAFATWERVNRRRIIRRRLRRIAQ